MNPVIPRFFKRMLVVIAVVLVVVYASDYLILRLRMATHIGGESFGVVTVYDAAAMKNGKVEVYYHVPFPEVCVRSLFPHQGRTPCWYLNRSPVKLISLLMIRVR